MTRFLESPVMRCPTVADLPPPPPSKIGWPWTEASPPTPNDAPDGRTWPKISIVTASFNDGEFIEETIRSVLLQGYPDLNYIIIDGGSKDNSVEIIRKYERWLSYWVSESDDGPVDATNKGLAVASGEVFGLMCADDYFAPGGLLKLVNLRFANPTSIAWVGACQVIDLNSAILDPGLPFVCDPKQIGNWGVGAWFVSVACLFDAGCYRSIGGLDNRFRNGGDVDLWIRLSKKGSFSLTKEIVASARRRLDSWANGDRPLELSSWIASNYINGNYDVARAVLIRYGEEQIAQAATRLSVGNFARLKVRSVLAKAGRIANRLQRRAVDLIATRSE